MDVKFKYYVERIFQQIHFMKMKCGLLIFVGCLSLFQLGKIIPISEEPLDNCKVRGVRWGMPLNEGGLVVSILCSNSLYFLDPYEIAKLTSKNLICLDVEKAVEKALSPGSNENKRLLSLISSHLNSRNNLDGVTLYRTPEEAGDATTQHADDLN